MSGGKIGKQILISIFNLSDGTPNILRISLYTRINDFLKRVLE